jgi:flagellar capping protein FliD
MIFNSSNEQTVEAAEKDWDEVQDVIVKGVEHFAGVYPFEASSVGDWNKRGKRDALRDLRLMDRSDLAKAGGELEGVIDNLTKMVKANPWLGKMGNEMVATLKSFDSRVRGGFPTVDAIANLQSLKAYAPGHDMVKIDFPDREVLDRVLQGIQEVVAVQGKIEMVESRMFELEKVGHEHGMDDKIGDTIERIDRLEKQLEKVSNILTMLNSKVEAYFSKTAEKERQADLERKIEEYTTKALSHESKIAALEQEAEGLLTEMKNMTSKMEKDVHDSRKRIARVEKHFVDFAKMVQE